MGNPGAVVWAISTQMDVDLNQDPRKVWLWVKTRSVPWWTTNSLVNGCATLKTRIFGWSTFVSICVKHCQLVCLLGCDGSINSPDIQMCAVLTHTKDCATQWGRKAACGVCRQQKTSPLTSHVDFISHFPKWMQYAVFQTSHPKNNSSVFLFKLCLIDLYCVYFPQVFLLDSGWTGLLMLS